MNARTSAETLEHRYLLPLTPEMEVFVVLFLQLSWCENKLEDLRILTLDAAWYRHMLDGVALDEGNDRTGV